MRTLYIHGMDVVADDGQLKILSDYVHDVYALNLDYHNGNEFDVLSKYIKKNEIGLLIGHSYGGFLSYWLAEEFGIPCININPLLSVRLRRKMQPAISRRACPICLTVLSAKDELVDYEQTLKFLELEKRDDKIDLIKILDDQGHYLSNGSFAEQIAWALGLIDPFFTKDYHLRIV